MHIAGRQILFTSFLVLAMGANLSLARAETPHAPGAPYAPRNLPDRIVLTPDADPARAMAVAYRTDKNQTETIAEITSATDGPSLSAHAVTVKGDSVPLVNENGEAIYHHIRFTGLKPGAVYDYRVKGAAGWSPWLQFRTAAAGFEPFRFLYFGDTQNNILSIGSRNIRQAFHDTAAPALAVHAGDLTAGRKEMVHDDEWGEWTEAGGYNYAMVPEVPAPGNHEYTDGATHPIGPHWGATFTLPGNGADALKATTYTFEYQTVRFIVLDGTAALEGGAMEGETAWLKGVLAANKSRWTVVVMHQPMFMCARPDDLEPLKANWKPLFEKHHVDLVLQGHDHCYSRISNPAGKAAGEQAHGVLSGPVYMISVTGSKMYGLNSRTLTQPDRVAEDTQMFNVVDVEAARLKFRAFTGAGRLYDAFDVVRGGDGKNRLVDPGLALPPVRTCNGAKGPDDAPCTARDK